MPHIGRLGEIACCRTLLQSRTRNANEEKRSKDDLRVVTVRGEQVDHQSNKEREDEADDKGASEGYNSDPSEDLGSRLVN